MEFPLIFLCALKCIGAGFAGTDSNHLLQIEDEYLAVADFAGVRRLGDRFQHNVQLLIGHGDLELDLGQKIHDIFGAAIQLGMALLSAKSSGQTTSTFTLGRKSTTYSAPR